MHVHTLLMAQLRQLKSKDSLLHLAFSGIRNPCFLLLHVCGNCFRFSSGRCFPEQIKSLLSGCRLCCLRSLQNICILCSQTFIILSNYKHTFFTRYEYTNNCQKEINLFHIKQFLFFHNKASKTSPVLLAPPFLFTEQEAIHKGYGKCSKCF